MIERNGFRLQVVAVLLSLLQVVVMGMGAYILNDIHDRVVRLENLKLGDQKNEKVRSIFSNDPALRDARR